MSQGLYARPIDGFYIGFAHEEKRPYFLNVNNHGMPLKKALTSGQGFSSEAVFGLSDFSS